MTIIENPARKDWEKLTRRPAQKFKKIEKIVKPILKKVKKKGDAALRHFALEYDHVKLNSLRVDELEFNHASQQIDASLKEAIRVAYDNIYRFHEAQKTSELLVETVPGVRCYRRSVPI